MSNIIGLDGTKIGKLRGDEKAAHATFPDQSNMTPQLVAIQAMRREGFMKGAEYKSEFFEDLLAASVKMSMLWNELMKPDSESCKVILAHLELVPLNLRYATKDLQEAFKKLAAHMEEAKK